MNKMCDECGVNPAMHMLRNGQELKSLCDVCLKDSLYEFVVNSDEISFEQRQEIINRKSESVITIA